MQSAKKPAHFPCNKCNYVASYRPHLKRHIKTVHDKIKDFACSLCTFRSGHRESLRKHIQAVHDKIKDATCKYCEYKTSRGDTLKQHVKKHHGNIGQLAFVKAEHKELDNPTSNMSPSSAAWKMTETVKSSDILNEVAKSLFNESIESVTNTMKFPLPAQPEVPAAAVNDALLPSAKSETSPILKTENLDKYGFLDEVAAPMASVTQPESARSSDLKNEVTTGLCTQDMKTTATAIKLSLPTQSRIAEEPTTTNGAKKAPAYSFPPPFMNFSKFDAEGRMQPPQKAFEKPLNFDLKAAMAKAPVAGGTGCYVTYGKILENQSKCSEAGYYQCTMCNREFSSPNSLGQHITIHTRKIQHRCDLCGHVFGKRDYLLNHVRLHTVEMGPVFADYKDTSEKEPMKQKEPTKLNHIHNNYAKPLKIQDTKTAEVKSNPDILNGPKLEPQLKLHDVSNTDDISPKSRDTEANEIKAPNAHSIPRYEKNKDRPKPFACDQCPFKTAHKQKLLTHIKILHEKSMGDENAKYFDCNQCSFKTVYKQNLRSHISVIHDKVKTRREATGLACELCSYTTFYKWNLKKHIKGVHD